MNYQIIDQLKRHKAALQRNVKLSDGIELAAWSNRHQLVSVQSNHHTLSLYVKGGHDCHLKTAFGWKSGGGPGRFCLMPKEVESVWDIRDGLDFVHLYYTDQHLREAAVKIWDREPSQVELPLLAFEQDETIRALYHMFILNSDWADCTNSLQLGSCSILLLNHLLKAHSNIQWPEPVIKGGLSPSSLNNVVDWVESNLGKVVTVDQLAEQANLSFYHFAHMFKVSTGSSPHHYVMERRLLRAFELVERSVLPLMEIASQLGFSSAAHFTTRFKRRFGEAPSRVRAQHFNGR